MSQTEKAALYKELQDAGVQFSKHYREYKTSELAEAVNKLRERLAEEGQAPLFDVPAPEQGYNGNPATEPAFDPEATAAAYAAMSQPVESATPAAPGNPPPSASQAQAPPRPTAPVARANPDEMPGVRLNTNTELEPIRVDPDTGLVWYQEEVRKPAYPKPRGRRVLKYMDSGTKTETVKDGKYVETFEVAGDSPGVATEARITLPSYQVGIYKDPRLPFKVHVYNGHRGFDLFEVQNYYGGAELVPAEIKRIYVENVLCYDIRTTVRAIQTEYRHLQLQGKVK